MKCVCFEQSGKYFLSLYIFLASLLDGHILAISKIWIPLTNKYEFNEVCKRKIITICIFLRTRTWHCAR